MTRNFTGTATSAPAFAHPDPVLAFPGDDEEPWVDEDEDEDEDDEDEDEDEEEPGWLVGPETEYCILG